MKIMLRPLMLRYTVLFFCATIELNAIGQVGLNNPNPDPSSLLDMKATDKGLLVPRLTTVQRDLMLTGAPKPWPSNSLLVYDSDQDMFYFFDTLTSPDRWMAVNPWHTIGNNKTTDVFTNTSGKVGIGTSQPTEKLEINGNAKAAKFIGDGIVPSGGIIMWSGSAGSIPNGWALCDGRIVNGLLTPDLRGRFIVGYDDRTGGALPAYSHSDYNSIGMTGGQKEITVTINQMPSHNHGGQTSNNNVSLNHQHDYYLTNDMNVSNNNSNDLSLRSRSNINYSGFKTSGISATTNSNNNLDHTHGITSQGGGQPIENRPPYYVLAFIIKLP